MSINVSKQYECANLRIFKLQNNKMFDNQIIIDVYTRPNILQF